MITPELMDKVFSRLVRGAPLPIRQPSFTCPDFWSAPINQSRARLIPDPGPLPGTWLDYLTVRPQTGYPRVITKFVATSEVLSAVEYRWIYKGNLFAPDQMILDPAVERHLDRQLVHPYPCTQRQTYIVADDTSPLVLQARLLVAGPQRAFASIQGWYYPDLGSPDEVTRQTGVTDYVRNF